MEKKRIADLGKPLEKVTIADEITVGTRFAISPPLTTREIMVSLVDLSDQEFIEESRIVAIIEGHRVCVPIIVKEALVRMIPPHFFDEGVVTFEGTKELRWYKVKTRVLKKYNLTDLIFKSQAAKICSITIESRAPLYDQNAHVRHCAAVLRAIKIRHPKSVFVNDGCTSSAACQTGLVQALRKLAEDTQAAKR